MLRKIHMKKTKILKAIRGCTGCAARREALKQLARRVVGKR